MPVRKKLRYRVRRVNPSYYQKLAFSDGKVVAVSGYLRRAGKDKKLYELQKKRGKLVKVGKEHWRSSDYSQKEVSKDYGSI